MASIHSLPNEILVYVARNLDQVVDLASLARTSRRLHAFANPELYVTEHRSPNPRALVWAAEHGRAETLRLALATGAVVGKPFFSPLSLADLEKAAQERKTRKNDGEEARDGGPTATVSQRRPPQYPHFDEEDEFGDEGFDFDDWDEIPDDLDDEYGYGLGDEFDPDLWPWEDDLGLDGLYDSDDSVDLDDPDDSDDGWDFDEELGLVPPFPTGFWWSALHVAAHNGHAEIVEILLENGAPLESRSRGVCQCRPVRCVCFGHLSPLPTRDPRFVTPLHVAICQGNDDIAKLLLKQGASIQVDYPHFRGSSPRSSAATALHIAAHKGNIKLMRLILEDDKYQVNPDVLDDEGVTPLAFACVGRQWKAVNWLVKREADINVPLSGVALLLDACLRRRFDDALRLIDLGASVHATLPNHGAGALHLACDAVTVFDENYSEVTAEKNGRELRLSVVERQRGRLIERLIEKGANLEVRDHLGMTPILVAARTHIVNASELLLSAGADTAVENRAHETILELACIRFRNLQTILGYVKKLLDSGVPVDQASCRGRTALYSVCHERLDPPSRMEIVRLLLERGANPNVQLVHDKETSPLKAAFIHRELDLCRLLLEHGANVTKDTAQNFCEIAISWSWADGLAFAFELTSHGAKQPRLKNLFTVLAKALVCGNQEFFTTLLANSKRVSKLRLDQRGNTLLHVVSECDNIDIIPYAVGALLKHGADLESKNSEGCSPLMRAIIYRNRSAVEALLDAGANPHLPSDNPQFTRRPLQEAILYAINGQTRLLNIILDNPRVENKHTMAAPQGVYLHTAVLGGKGKTDLLPAIVRQLLQHGQNPDAPDAAGNNALAALFLNAVAKPGQRRPIVYNYNTWFRSFWRTMVYFLAGGANINARNRDGVSTVAYFQRLVSHVETEHPAVPDAFSIPMNVRIVGKKDQWRMEIKRKGEWAEVKTTFPCTAEFLDELDGWLRDDLIAVRDSRTSEPGFPPVF